MSNRWSSFLSSPEKIQRIRMITGFIISPLVMPLVFYVTFLGIFGLENYNSEATLTSAKTIFWIYYIIALVVGIPAFHLLKRKGYDSLRNYAIGGGITGLLLIFKISTSFVYLFYILFSATGVLVGVCFWYIAIFKPKPSSKRSRRGRGRSRS